MVERIVPQFHRLMGGLKSWFIQNFKDTCKQPMSIVDLTNCKQEEGGGVHDPLGAPGQGDNTFV